jgi:hypothetical protein
LVSHINDLADGSGATRTADLEKLYSPEQIQDIVQKALKAVQERFQLLQDTAPVIITDYLRKPDNCCQILLQYLTQMQDEPMTLEKLFLADLAVAVTRVWEAFTRHITPGGDTILDNQL